MKVEEISRFSKNHLWGRFPYEDCRSLAQAGATDQLNPDLDIFLADVAGFATTPTTLSQRSNEQIEYGLQVLQKSFFERFPEHRPLATHITTEKTPQLFSQLSAAERLRPQLLKLLKQARANKQGKAFPK